MKDFVFALRNDNGYISDQKTLKDIINKNQIKNYDKLQKVNVGDYVICCDISESIDRYNNIHCFNISAWQDGKVIHVDKVEIKHYVYYITGKNATSGVYCSGIRFASAKEIKNYKSE